MTIPEEAITYVYLSPYLWDVVRARLGDEMAYGVHESAGEYLQELHVRYVKTRDVPTSQQKSPRQFPDEG